jgi:hypothetical protein
MGSCTGTSADREVSVYSTIQDGTQNGRVLVVVTLAPLVHGHVAEHLLDVFTTPHIGRLLADFA